MSGEALLSFAGCAVVISHDRWSLDRVATHMLALEGESKTFPYEGSSQEYEADRRKRLGGAADMPHRITCRKRTTGPGGRTAGDAFRRGGAIISAP